MKYFFSVLLSLFSLQVSAEVSAFGSNGGFVEFLSSNEVHAKAYAFTPIGKLELSGVFSNVMFHRAEVGHTKMSDCDFDQGDFSGAMLGNAEIENCIFRQTVFQNADFRNAKIKTSEFLEVDFSYSNLRGVDLSRSILGNSILSGSLFNSKTRLPFSHAEAIKRGMVYTGQ